MNQSDCYLQSSVVVKNVVPYQPDHPLLHMCTIPRVWKRDYFCIQKLFWGNMHPMQSPTVNNISTRHTVPLVKCLPILCVVHQPVIHTWDWYERKRSSCCMPCPRNFFSRGSSLGFVVLPRALEIWAGVGG